MLTKCLCFLHTYKCKFLADAYASIKYNSDYIELYKIILSTSRNLQKNACHVENARKK